MKHKYEYTGLQGAMKAQWMLAFFPELKLHYRNETIEQISITCRKDFKHVQIIHGGFSYRNDGNGLSNIKIIVPPEMESFFDEFTREDTIQVYTSENYFGDYPWDTLEELSEQYKGCKILKRRGIDFHMPERVI